MVFVSDNEASTHAVNLAVALARPDMDTIHIMHACTNDGVISDAQKLISRLTQGLGNKINSEVMVSCFLFVVTLQQVVQLAVHTHSSWSLLSLGW